MQTSHKVGFLLSLCMLLPFTSSDVTAALMVYSERSAWEAAVGATTTEDFEAVPQQWLATGPAFTFSEHPVGKISVGAKGDSLGEDNNPTIRDAADHLSVDGTRHLGGIVSNVEVIMQVALNFDSPVSAFGADWASATNRGGVTLTVHDEAVMLADYLPSPGNGFVGLVASESFQQVLLTTNRWEDYGLDNVSFNVPEPSTGWLILTALMFTVTIKWRRHNIIT